MSLLGSIFGAASSGLGGMSQSLTGAWQTRKTIQHQESLAEKEYKRALEMWNRENVYNSPVNQMKRLKEAGLNPNLMYSQGDTGKTMSSPRYQAPNVDYSGFKPMQLLDALRSYTDIKMRGKQMDHLNKQIELTEAEKQSKVIHNLLQSKKIPWASRQAKADYMSKMQGIMKMHADTENSKYQHEVMNELLKEKTMAQTRLLKHEDKWMQEGMTKSDPLWARQLSRAMKKAKGKVELRDIQDFRPESDYMRDVKDSHNLLLDFIMRMIMPK